MTGTQLRELRLYRGFDIPAALGLTSATETATQWAAIEASDSKVPAKIEQVWGLIKLPRTPKSFSVTTTSV